MTPHSSSDHDQFGQGRCVRSLAHRGRSSRALDVHQRPDPSPARRDGGSANAKGQLVGFAKGTKNDHPEYGGELNKIYLLREYQRMGLGRRLVCHVARRFLSEGVTSMWLFGDARNPSSNAWLALGAVKTDDDPGNGNYGWRDLRRLVESCPDSRGPIAR